MNKQFSPFLQRYFLIITEVICSQIGKYKGIFIHILIPNLRSAPLPAVKSINLNGAHTQNLSAGQTNKLVHPVTVCKFLAKGTFIRKYLWNSQTEFEILKNFKNPIVFIL